MHNQCERVWKEMKWPDTSNVAVGIATSYELEGQGFEYR